jgi:hypothetical protein
MSQRFRKEDALILRALTLRKRVFAGLSKDHLSS